jgi:hypothetical protein
MLPCQCNLSSRQARCGRYTSCEVLLAASRQAGRRGYDWRVYAVILPYTMIAAVDTVTIRKQNSDR